ncbi:MAG: rhomboid family intramembrane serine protease [Gemmatimonadota bacterium]
MTPWVFRLLIANLAVFVLTSLEPRFANYLALYPRAILVQPWGIFTYMFVHAGLGHIFFNMLGLFFFGPRLEVQLGGRYFLRLYLLSGLGGAAFSFLFAPHAGVVGASGAVFGVLLGFAYFWPKEPIYIWGVLPIESRWLVGLLAAAALYSGISGTGAGTAHFAHLGGFVAGYAYLRWRKRRYSKQWSNLPTPKKALEKTARKAGDGEAKRRWSAIRLEDLHELNRDEVARLLKKVEESGPGSLSPQERSVLDRFAARH